jgi:hypothetical protein
MKFVRTEDLKAGMRLAKPIYNKKGVLLYERNSALTAPGIASAKNFGLIGVYILEPAEPLPPLSREDLEFEQLQTVYIFRLREVLNCITERRKLEKYPVFLEDILSHYGSLKHRVNFNQNLRSSDDFMYKHAISTAILVTMMGAHLRLPKEKLRILTTAAYKEFVTALAGAGISETRANVGDETLGVCPTGQRVVFQFFDDNQTIFQTWSTTCNSVRGSLKSSRQTLRTLNYSAIMSAGCRNICQARCPCSRRT